MNRRNIIRGLAVAAGTLPALRVLPDAAKDSESVKREALRGLLAVSDKEAHELHLLRIAMNDGHYCRDYALELFEAGVPMAEIQQRVTDRVKYNCYGPKGVPVYDEHGVQVGGGSLAWRTDS